MAYNLCCLAIVAGGYYYFTGGFVEPFVASLTMCFGFVLSFSSASLSLNMGFLRSDSEESSNSMKPSNSTIIDKQGDEMLNTNIGNNTAFTEEGKSLIAAQAI